MLEFGIFDHLDSDGSALGALMESRLRLVELIEAQGFSGYHLAEHHSTPLGMASSPSVFLAAAIARTKRIRLGPLVYVLPLYHPLRLYEEICMLDHLSGGRLMVGVGRGGALIEHQRYGVDPAAAPAMYHEAFAVLMRAFESDVLDFEGKFYNYKDYVVQAKPLQRPHPPIWYGAPNAEAIAWAAPHAVNVVSLGPAARARAIAERYRQEWTALGRDAAALPKIGITRHIVVAHNRRASRTHRRRRLSALAAGHGLAVAPLRRSPSRSRKSTRRIFRRSRRSATASPVRRRACAIISRGLSRKPASITCSAR